jgi:hypothetical protein
LAANAFSKKTSFCASHLVISHSTPCFSAPSSHQHSCHLVHLLDESVDVLLPVTQVTTLDEMPELALVEATSWVRQLEGPEEVAGLLEVGADSEDLVDQILHADNAKLAQVVLNQLIVGERDALLVDLAVSTLVHEFAHGLEVGVTVRDVWVDDCEHLLCGLGEANEDTIVDLEETEELEDLAGLGGDLVDTLDTENEDKLVLVWDVERTVLLAQASESDLLTLGIAVLLDVGLGALEDDTTLLLVGLY